MEFFLRIIYFLILFVPFLDTVFGNSIWSIHENFPIVMGFVLQFIAGISLFIYTGGRGEGNHIKIQTGYILFFLGLSGSYYSGKSLYLPFFWELSTLGAFLIFLAGKHRKSSTMSLIALVGASGISCSFLAGWVLLPDGNKFGVIFFLSALLVKSAFSVMHLWYPDLHEGSPHPHPQPSVE